MQFDVTKGRRKQKSPDKLQPIRNLFEMWNNSLLDQFFVDAI